MMTMNILKKLRYPVFKEVKTLFLLKVGFLGFIFLGGSLVTSVLLGEEPNPKTDLTQVAWPSNILYNTEDTIFLVDKDSREVRVYKPRKNEPQLALVKAADIGKNQGDKQRENDHRTPEGIYFLKKKLSPPEIPFDLYGSLALTSDYPNYFDRLMGKTGYGIWLHAVPDTVPLTRGSRGCVVVDNQSIRELEAYAQLGKSPMVIVPKAEYLSSEKIKTRQEELLLAIEKWRKTWESQDLDSYLQHYHDKFEGSGFNKAGWAQHKAKVKKQYTNIKIELEPLLVLQFGNQILARFKQRYQADQYEDFGRKILYAFYESGQPLQILREDWKALNDTSSEGSSDFFQEVSQR
jgi:murein L,D-transpeptidase YafK